MLAVSRALDIFCIHPNTVAGQDQLLFVHTPLGPPASSHPPLGFPKLYFKDPKDGKFEEVSNGGLLIYYQNRGNEDVRNGGPGLKAFPPGFKMISGRPTRRGTKYVCVG